MSVSHAQRSAIRNILASIILLVFTLNAQAMHIWVDQRGYGLNMSNEIHPSDTDTLNRMILSGELDKVNTIFLWDSEGGHVDTALAIGHWIHDRGYTTNVIDQCASACVHIALAGANKFISDDGALHTHWMHMPNDSYMTPVEVSYGIQERLRSIWEYAEMVGGKADAYMFLMMTAGPELKQLSKAEARNIGFVYQ